MLRLFAYTHIFANSRRANTQFNHHLLAGNTQRNALFAVAKCTYANIRGASDLLISALVPHRGQLGMIRQFYQIFFYSVISIPPHQRTNLIYFFLELNYYVIL